MPELAMPINKQVVYAEPDAGSFIIPTDQIDGMKPVKFIDILAVPIPENPAYTSDTQVHEPIEPIKNSPESIESLDDIDTDEVDNTTDERPFTNPDSQLPNAIGSVDWIVIILLAIIFAIVSYYLIKNQ